MSARSSTSAGCAGRHPALLGTHHPLRRSPIFAGGFGPYERRISGRPRTDFPHRIDHQTLKAMKRYILFLLATLLSAAVSGQTAARTDSLAQHPQSEQTASAAYASDPDQVVGSGPTRLTSTTTFLRQFRFTKRFCRAAGNRANSTITWQTPISRSRKSVGRSSTTTGR